MEWLACIFMLDCFRIQAEQVSDVVPGLLKRSGLDGVLPGLVLDGVRDHCSEGCGRNDFEDGLADPGR